MKRFTYLFMGSFALMVNTTGAQNIVMPPAAVPDANNPSSSTIVVAAPTGQTGTTQVQPNRNGQISGPAVVTGVTPANFQYHRPPGSNLGREVISPLPPVIMPDGRQVRTDTIDSIGNLQLTPQQIQDLKRLQIERDRARATPYPIVADPVVRTLALDLSPGKSPPALRLSMGFQTSVVFSDGGGNPWMIESVSLNRTLFSDGQRGMGESAQPTNVLTLEPLSSVPYGNVTVMLKGMSTPIILILTSGQDKVDARVDAKVPGHNPDAYAAVSYISSPQRDANIGYFLDGVPPEGAKRLKVTGGMGAEAWSYQNHTYLKTAADVQFPAFLHAAKSTTGVNVFRFPNKPSSVSLLAGGRATTIFIE